MSNKNYRIAYALKQNYGSDREVGWNWLKEDLDENNSGLIYFVGYEDYKYLDLKLTNINLKTFSLEKYFLYIPRMIRFQIWLQFIQIYLLIKMNDLDKVNFITFTQIASFIWIQRFKQNIWIGPVGTIAKVNTWKDTPLKIKSILIHSVCKNILRLITPLNNEKRYVIHPNLKNYFSRESDVCQAICPEYINYVENNEELSKSISVIAVGRDVRFKRFKFIREVFNILGKSHQCLLINSNLENGTLIQNEKFSEIGKITREEVLKNFSKSKIHFMPSYELAGYVNYESVANGCVTISMKGNGASYILNPSEDYLFNELDTAEQVAEKIIHILENKNINHEYQHQCKNSKLKLQKTKNKLLEIKK
ncbi:glycosyltransferase [Paraglaciecola sp.]|uniref:glycosyltransferase n=1 Tax=Paraglaciecola sp. TaxID=1920173 RepID=UPI003EF55475